MSAELGWGSGQGLAQPHSLGQLLILARAAQSSPSPLHPGMCSSTGMDWGSSSSECLGYRGPTASESILRE